MKREDLKRKRRNNPLIHTDNEGNLTGYNPEKVSGAKLRKEQKLGEFKKHDATGSYISYSSNPNREDGDERIE